jgi:probable phosphoglycerate mutase
MSRRLLLIRHGESEWNRERRWQGWVDIDLTERGVLQAKERAELLAATDHGLVAAWCSDLIRARRTAEILAEHLHLGAVVSDERLRERHGGVFQGHTRREIEAKYPGEIDRWVRGESVGPPDGETDEQVLERCMAAVRDLDARTPPGAAMIVSHGGLLRVASIQAGLHRGTPISNVGGWWFTYADGVLRDPEPIGELPVDGTRSDATE